jgi:hypothetical protein
MGERMLLAWGQQVLAGESAENIITKIDHIRETGMTPGGWPPKGAASFTSHAATADILLREMYQIDRESAEYLIAFAFGLSLSDMVRVMEIRNRSAANLGYKEAMAKWTMAVYYRSTQARELMSKLDQQAKRNTA